MLVDQAGAELLQTCGQMRKEVHGLVAVPSKVAEPLQPLQAGNGAVQQFTLFHGLALEHVGDEVDERGGGGSEEGVDEGERVVLPGDDEATELEGEHDGNWVAVAV